MSEDLIGRSDAIKAITSLHILADEEKIFKVYADNPHSMTTDFEGTLIDVINAIKSIPTIEPKRGEWIDEADKYDASFGIHDYRCSNCNSYADECIGGYEWYTADKPNFCPNCGARMKGADDES